MSFGTADFILIGVFSCISILVGVYHGIRGYLTQRRNAGTVTTTSNQHQATDEYLLAGRKLPFIPTVLSTISSFLSGILFLGVPADVFNRGIYMFMFYAAGALSFPFTAFFIVPRFYALNVTSIYEYFQHRFSSAWLRKISSILFILATVGCGMTCTLYTAMGGLKAVVWTDTIQAAIMYLGLGILITKGMIDAGGFTRVYHIAKISGRFDAITTLDPNPMQYMSVWISLYSGFMYWIGVYGLNQMSQQRYCNLPSMKEAQRVVALSAPGFLILGGMATVLGLTMLAYYDTCAPPDVKTIDQYVIRFAVDVLGSIPGLQGLFIVSVFSGTLSTVSSGINSLSAVIWVDFVKPAYPNMTDRNAKLFNMFMVFSLGVISTSLTYICVLLKGMLRTATLLVSSFSGPIVGLFIFGLFIPRASRIGAFTGLITSCVVIACTAGGQIYLAPYDNFKLPPVETLCPNASYFTTSNVTLYHDQYGIDYGFPLFRISAYSFTAFSSAIVVVVGGLVSLVFPDDKKVRMNYKEVKQLIVDVHPFPESEAL